MFCLECEKPIRSCCWKQTHLLALVELDLTRIILIEAECSLGDREGGEESYPHSKENKLESDESQLLSVEINMRILIGNKAFNANNK